MATRLLGTLTDASRYTAGALLVVAAGLKWFSPTYTDSTFFLVTNGPLHDVIVVAECLLGVSLLLRLFGGVEVVLGLVVFLGFTAVNVWNAMSGSHSCGCFGSLRVSPWLMLVVDGTLTVGLATLLFVNKPNFLVRWRRAALTGIGFALLLLAVRVGGFDHRLRGLLGGAVVYAEPRPVEVGEHPPGTTVDASVRLHNVTDGPIRVVGLEHSSTALARPGFVQVIPAGSSGELPLSFTVRGRPGRHLAENVLFCEVSGSVTSVPLTAAWTVREP